MIDTLSSRTLNDSSYACKKSDRKLSCVEFAKDCGKLFNLLMCSDTSFVRFCSFLFCFFLNCACQYHYASYNVPSSLSFDVIFVAHFVAATFGVVAGTDFCCATKLHSKSRQQKSRMSSALQCHVVLVL